MASQPSPHRGHRQRMRQRFYQTELNGFQPHEIIELILYGSIPQRDVNPLAHALIDRFGSVDGVLSAAREELMAVSGVGARTADLLACMNELCHFYVTERFACRQVVTCISEAVAVIRPLLPEGNVRQLGILCQDSTGSLIAARAFPWPLQDREALCQATGMALELNSHSAVLVIARPGATRRPGKVELLEISQLVDVLTSADVYVMDALILYGQKTMSLRQEGILSDENASLRDDDAWQKWFGGNRFD